MAIAEKRKKQSGSVPVFSKLADFDQILGVYSRVHIAPYGCRGIDFEVIFELELTVSKLRILKTLRMKIQIFHIFLNEV